MEYQSLAEFSRPVIFKADFLMRCSTDFFEIEIERSILQIERNDSSFIASFEALIVLIDLSNRNNRAIVRFDVRQLDLSNFENHFRCSASKEHVSIEMITSEDEEIRRRFYDVIEDWMTEFELHVYTAD